MLADLPGITLRLDGVSSKDPLQTAEHPDRDGTVLHQREGLARHSFVGIDLSHFWGSRPRVGDPSFEDIGQGSVRSFKCGRVNSFARERWRYQQPGIRKRCTRLM
jgi:hypothetical protein